MRAVCHTTGRQRRGSLETHARVGGGEFADNFRGAISRAVVEHDDFETGNFISKNGADGGGDVGLLVAGRDEDGARRRRAAGPGKRRVEREIPQEQQRRE